MDERSFDEENRRDRDYGGGRDDTQEGRESEKERNT